MKHRKQTFFQARLTPLVMTGLAAAATPVGAQDVTAKPQDAPKPDFSQFEAIEKAGWFVRLGGKALFNAKGSVTRSNPLPAEPGYYDNGFVRPDIGGTASGLTWNWGYEDYSQVSGDQLNFQRYLGLPNAGSFSDESAIAPGGEMMVGIKFGSFMVGKKSWDWGFELGGGFNLFQVSQSETVSGPATYNTASYNTGGILLPVPPYSGTERGPGPVIDLIPSTLSSTGTSATSIVDGTLESSLYNLKIGVWFDMPLTEKLSFAWSAGFSSLYADTQYHYTENITLANPAVPGIAPVDTTVNGRSWQQGGYIQARLNYNFSNHWSAYAAADYQYNGTMYFRGANRDIKMDFTALFGASLGIAFNW